jgi:hypothetical protein
MTKLKAKLAPTAAMINLLSKIAICNILTSAALAMLGRGLLFFTFVAFLFGAVLSEKVKKKNIKKLKICYAFFAPLGLGGLGF